MEIRNCPECGDETVNAGSALWSGVDGPVVVAECQGCGWAGVELEYCADEYRADPPRTRTRIASAA